MQQEAEERERKLKEEEERIAQEQQRARMEQCDKEVDEIKVRVRGGSNAAGLQGRVGVVRGRAAGQMAGAVNRTRKGTGNTGGKETERFMQEDSRPWDSKP